MRRFALLLLIFLLCPVLATVRCGGLECPTGLDACCGTSCYNSETHGCCAGSVVYIKEVQQCCEGGFVCPTDFFGTEINCTTCMQHGLGQSIPMGEEKLEIKQAVKGYVRQFFGFWEFFKIKGARDPISGMFNAEFLAAFFMIYFLIGSATGFRGIGGGIPKLLMVLIITAVLWNVLGGFRWERFVIFLIPPVLVYYIIQDSLGKFTMVRGGTVKLIALTAAAIAFLFVSPQFITFVNGQFSFGLLDNLQMVSTVFFIIVIAGFIFTKLSITVMLPLQKVEGISKREMLMREIQNLSEEKRKKVLQYLELRKKFEEVEF